MRTHSFALLILATLVPTACHAQSKCPWITEATARGILGGPVTAKISLKDWGNGTCDFSRQQGALTLELQISVDVLKDIPKQFPSYLAQCAKSTPVTAIGNEAVTCSLQDKDDRYAEKIVGRVRDQAFVVTVSSSAADDPAMTQDMRREKVHLAAEQVAGILF
jgi:hypothetical protein